MTLLHFAEKSLFIDVFQDLLREEIVEVVAVLEGAVAHLEVVAAAVGVVASHQEGVGGPHVAAEVGVAVDVAADPKLLWLNLIATKACLSLEVRTVAIQ